MLLIELKDAEVILENEAEILYFLVDSGIAVSHNKEDYNLSYVVLSSIDQMWETIKENLEYEYFNINKGQDLINVYAV